MNNFKDKNYYCELYNNREYEVYYHHFVIDDNIFLCKAYQCINEDSDMDVDIACTKEEYELDELQLDEDTMISKKEFIFLYKKFKNSFEINTIKQF